MLEKSELVFEGLRLGIDFGGYPLNLQILQEDPGMHLVIMEDNLEILKKLIINDSNISGFDKFKEIDLMTNDSGKVTADCQFCGAKYILSPSELGYRN